MRFESRGQNEKKHILQFEKDIYIFFKLAFHFKDDL
jgi:hypothetical protein